ncbi:fatty acyl-AMP ligase [Kitasatospora cheerisanensis]|uniref:Uncharacterized protein n=1 Tax=Kitasatospora cheerisanensis KCTC 2395 TaxID=1348663 RepID=A0A066YQM5_9ACTN|nr:fatty acyl-AMP ligase [Kitasatospora cheerisanensis]KDN83853.1 hypothetical protein KCH_45020 [Kitasatospora cheerisanensis KCTC 2395]
MGTPGQVSTISALLSENAQQRADERAFTILNDGHDESDVMTHASLDLEARAIAARLQQSARPGDRALVLATDNAHFIRAFMACQHAGVIAVPIAPPLPLRNPRKAATMRAIAADSGARIVLTGSTTQLREPVRTFAPDLAELEWIDVDTVPVTAAADFRAPRIDAEDISFLQYTSGSTALPKGVMVSHRALLANEEMFAAIMGLTAEDVIVSWLPLFHDMGLIGKVLQASYLGTHLVLMPPAAFVQRPARWLRAITKYRGTMAGAPNFAYDMCVSRIAEQDRAEFDLSSWKVAFSGAEPIRPATFDAFAKAYAPYGLAPETMQTAYGLAEVTLIASGGVRGEAPITTDVDHDALRKGQVVPGGDYTMISVGKARLSRRIAIVDPVTKLAREQGTVGEIWLAGDDVPPGYWGNPEATLETFQARIADTGEGPFLRTGDLGVLHQDELYITGRLKDVIIVGGQNHYPQDLEETAESAHPWVRPGFGCAFALERDGREQVVLVAEILRPLGSRRTGSEAAKAPLPTLAEIRRKILAAVSDQHGIRLDDVLLVPVASAPKTSSGKIQRSTCRAAYEAGELKSAPEPGGQVLEEIS